jgi:hypothetical protein
MPALDEPALSIRRAIVEVEKVDLLARRVAIGSLTLDDTVLAARPDLMTPIPVLEGARAVPAAGPAAAVPGGKATPWRWSIARVTAPSARVDFLGHDGTAVFDASLSAENLGPAAYWSPVRAWFRHGDGAAAFDGSARMTNGLVIDGRLTAGAIDVPAFARAVGLPFADLALAGRGAADLNLELAPAEADGSTVDLRGKVSLVGVSIAGPDPAVFALDADAVDLELGGIVARQDAQDRRSAEMKIASATFGAPRVQLARTPEGWVLPPFTDDVAADGTMPPSEPVATPTAEPVDAAPPVQLEEPPSPVQLSVERLRANGGHVTIVDTASIPAVTFDLAVREGWGSGFRFPDGTLGDFVLAGTDRRLGALRLAGTGSGAGRALELSGDDVPLAAVAPFLARAGFPYRLEGGTASFLSRLDVVAGRWTADTTLTVREPTLAGDTAALQATLGRSVESALAALRDPNGDVTFQVALAAAAPGEARTLPATVAQAVRDAIDGAAPFRIAFVPGRADPTVHGARQITAIAEVLETRANLVVQLAAPVSNDDRRWLAEQALAAELEPAGGFKGVLRTFGIRDSRERIRRALQERAQGEPGQLDDDDQEELDDLLARRPPVDPGRLEALAAARVARITTELGAQYAIAPTRVVVTAAKPEDGAAPPAVRGRIGVESRIARIAAPPVTAPVGPPAPPAVTTTREAW